ncbi:thioesterase family protein [Leucobacter albus]|uniref:Thioesterase family protein n=1 Tax=Leucobacter albus TaxID=272210 RepID=A0ABW3TM82_9MICO
MTAPRPAYFRQLSPTRFEATEFTSGAWNTSEQHIAPAIGLLAHLIEADHRSRGGQLRLASLSCDILGVLAIGEFDVEVSVVRPGRTIELVEAVLTSGGRTGVRARAWMLQTADTEGVAGSGFAAMPALASTPPFPFGETWEGQCVKTLEVRREQLGAGRGRSWVRTDTELLAGATVSEHARFVGMLDFANGLVPRANPAEIAFPNVDLNVSFFRAPAGDWLGLDTTVSFGPDAVGLTESVVHDEHGPVGTLSQTLTIRA